MIFVTDIDCGNFTTLENGVYILVDSSDTTFGAKADVTCDAGYIASVDVITCTINGTWANATCSAIGKHIAWNSRFEYILKICFCF